MEPTAGSPDADVNVPAVRGASSISTVGAATRVITMEIASGFSDRVTPLGLGEAVELRGGDRLHRGGIAFDLAMDWHPQLMRLVEQACDDQRVRGREWFTMPPALLVGPKGVGRTHIGRRLAAAAGVPHILFDIAGDSHRRVMAPPDAPALIAPIIGMALTRCANPIASVVGVDQADSSALSLLMRLLDPQRNRRFVDPALAAVLDLGQVTWLVQTDAPDDLPDCLREAAVRVDLDETEAEDTVLVAIDLIAEVITDHGLDRPAASEIEAILAWVARGTYPYRRQEARVSVVDLYARIRARLGRPDDHSTLYLLVRDVPFVDASLRVRRGVIISNLDLAGDRTIPPTDHTAWFSGGCPCDAAGRRLGEMAHGHAGRYLGGGVTAEYFLCSKPAHGEFRDFHEKITTFVAQISNHAVAIDPTVTARTGRVMTVTGGRSTFAYVDTASSRNGIGAFNERLAGQSIGVVGLGGTGGYVLDLLAKCPVHRIHLFDADSLEQHNAFRAPGAPTLDELRERPSKVAHFEHIYSRMHNGIIAHGTRLGSTNLHLLDHLDFVFLCVDSAASRRVLVEEMERRGMSFIDVGLGMHVVDAGLVGAIRVTTSTPEMREADRPHPRIPVADILDDHPYGTAAQVADLNCLAATLAVIRWKRLCGFYLDLAGEHNSVFTVDGNHILNEDRVARRHSDE